MDTLLLGDPITEHHGACKVPYRQWVHEHTFEERDGGTLMRDRVDFAVPGGLLEPALARLIVAPDVRRIFAYRRQKMKERFCRG